MNKLKIILATIIVSYLPITISAENFCPIKQTSVYFGNGVWNSAEDAGKSMIEIKEAYQKQLETKYPDEVFSWDIADILN